MAIKRVTIELDDTDQHSGPTDVPDGLQSNSPAQLKAIEPTSFHQVTSSEETESEGTQNASPQKTGRTNADLIAEFIGNPRATATLLFVIPLVIFVGSIETIADFKIPITAGALLNAVWFGIPAISRLFKKKKNVT